MERVRHFLDGHRRAAWALVALTLLMKLVVPVGFMPQASPAGVALIVCDGMTHVETAAAMHGMAGHHHHAPTKPDAPCPFAGLTAPTLGGADPVRVAVAIAPIVAAGLSPVAPLPARTVAYLRPPLRGPPART